MEKKIKWIFVLCFSYFSNFANIYIPFKWVYFARISHTSWTYLITFCTFQTFTEFHNQIATVPKPLRVILCMFSKFIRSLCFMSHASRTYLAHILHLSRTFQTLTIKLLPFIIHLVILYMFSKFIRPLCFISHLSRTHCSL